MNNELNAYVGVLIESLKKQGYNPSEIKHIIVAGFIEYIMETLAVADKGYDYYALKPIFVALKQLIDTELKEKEPAAYIPDVQRDMANLSSLSEYLQHRIEVLKPL